MPEFQTCYISLQAFRLFQMFPDSESHTQIPQHKIPSLVLSREDSEIIICLSPALPQNAETHNLQLPHLGEEQFS